jgi:hypothetical protein
MLRTLKPTPTLGLSNHKQVAQIQKRQRQNAQPFPISNLSISIASCSLSPPPSSFLQLAAVVSLHSICTTPFAVVSNFFQDLLFRPPTCISIIMSSHQIPALSSFTAPVVNISAQDLMSLMGSMATSISALTASVQALVNAQANNANVRPFAFESRVIIKKPVIFKGKDSELIQLFRSAFCVWINANEDRFALCNSQGKKVQGANRATLLNVYKMILLALSFMAENAAVWA